jgi:hypothetical protein
MTPSGTKAEISLQDLEAFDPRAPIGGKERRFCCPLCGSQKRIDAAHRSLSVNMESGAWECHRCGAAGVVVERQAERRSSRERWLRPRRNEWIAGRQGHAAAPDPEKMERLKTQLEDLKPVAGSPGEAYLKRRGIASELAGSARVKYSAAWTKDAGKQRAGFCAVVFPFYNAAGALVAAQGRAISGANKITYGSKQQGVFATAGALDAEVVVIVEAPIDALSLAACGYPAIALGGLTVPEWLPKALAWRLVYIGFDNDKWGSAEVTNVGREFRAFGARIYRLRPPEGKDWNEALIKLGATDLTETLNNAITEKGLSIPRGIDPRPDLIEDSGRWGSLLLAAQNTDLYGPLHGFRCVGARIRKDAGGGLQICYDPEREGFDGQADFDEQYREWLEPHRQELERLGVEPGL